MVFSDSVNEGRVGLHEWCWQHDEGEGDDVGMLQEIPDSPVKAHSTPGKPGFGKAGSRWDTMAGEPASFFPLKGESLEDLEAMYAFKLRLCSDLHPHDWTLCPYAHEGEVARRRNPAYHSANPCSEYERTGSCRRGMRCPFAHGVWERGLHPQRYRTLLCAKGDKCTRPLCFFAHSETEVRQPVSSFESSIAAIKAMRRGGRAARRRVKNAGSASAAASTEISPDGAAAQTSSGTLSEAAAARSSEGTVPLAEQRRPTLQIENSSGGAASSGTREPRDGDTSTEGTEGDLTRRGSGAGTETSSEVSGAGLGWDSSGQAHRQADADEQDKSKGARLWHLWEAWALTVRQRPRHADCLTTMENALLWAVWATSARYMEQSELSVDAERTQRIRAMYRGVLDTRELRERAEKLADKEQDIIKWQATVALEGLQSLHGRRLGDRVDVPGAGLQPEAWVRKEVEALQSFDSAWVEDMIEDADEGWGAGGASGTRLASAASGEVMDWWGDVGGGFHQGGTHGAHWARLLDSVGEER